MASSENLSPASNLTGPWEGEGEGGDAESDWPFQRRDPTLPGWLLQTSLEATVVWGDLGEQPQQSPLA